MGSPLSRRSLLQVAAGLSAGALIPVRARAERARTAAFVRGRVRHAGIGVGGMGASDLNEISNHGAIDIVALCDVDADNLKAAAAKFPNARLYQDWRELFAREADALDSVHVTIPDHM